MGVETRGATLPNDDEVRRYTSNSAIARYNSAPQWALGGESPNDLVYGLPSESRHASSSAPLGEQEGAPRTRILAFTSEVDNVDDVFPKSTREVVRNINERIEEIPARK